MHPLDVIQLKPVIEATRPHKTGSFVTRREVDAVHSAVCTSGWLTPQIDSVAAAGLIIVTESSNRK